jgi:glycosyltransferase involved in cell wall biosynthesis
MTVARVIGRLNVGGPAIQAILMTAALREKGCRTLLIAGQVPPGEVSMEYLAEEQNVTPIRISKMSRKVAVLSDLQSLWMLVQIFARERPTVVHTHTAKAGTLGRIAAILTGVPVRVHTFHGHIFRGYFSPFVTRFFLAVERALARHTDRIITISDSQCRELVEVYKVAPREKMVTITLGLDLDPYLHHEGPCGTFREELGISETQPLLAWVGRLTAIKSPSSLIDCAQLLKAAGICPQFIMAGHGDLRDQCDRRIQAHGLENEVRMLGARRDLPSIYADSNFVVGTSLNEGTPVALLEAMASGKAFISTDVGGVRDLMLGPGQAIGGMKVFANGILVPCETKQIAAAIQYMLQNPALARTMGEKGREFVANRFSHARLADDLVELYAKLAKEKIGPSSITFA